MMSLECLNKKVPRCSRKHVEKKNFPHCSRKHGVSASVRLCSHQ